MEYMSYSQSISKVFLNLSFTFSILFYSQNYFCTFLLSREKKEEKKYQFFEMLLFDMDFEKN